MCRGSLAGMSGNDTVGLTGSQLASQNYTVAQYSFIFKYLVSLIIKSKQFYYSTEKKSSANIAVDPKLIYST
jgi:hypothetical protein